MLGRGGRAAAALWARTDLRRRWRSLVLLGVLAGVTAGFTMASVAGARRTETALARLKQRTGAPSAIVFASQARVINPDFVRLWAQPEVADLAVWDLVFGNIDGQTGGVLFASDDGRWGRDVNRPVLIAGRMWDPNSADEVVVDEIRAKQGTVIGSTVRLAMFGPDVRDFGNTTGPEVTLRVVGVVREVRQFLFTTGGQAFLGPGFVQRYRGRAAIHPNADVVLRDPGSAGVAALRRDVNGIVGPGTPVLDLHAVERRVDTTLAVERAALLLLAAAVALAGGLLVTQALVRSAAVIGDDVLVLRSIGLDRRGVVGAAGLSHVLSAAIAACVAFITAWSASRWFPVGLGRRIDPSVGTHVDWTVLGPGVLLTIVLTVAVTLVVAWRASSLATEREGHQPGSLVTQIRRRAPLTIGLGAAMAFDRGRGRASTPVGPALVGAVVGVLGVIGALTIDHGLHDALAHPERAGVTWDLTVTPPMTDVFWTPTGLQADFVATTKKGVGGSLAIMDRVLVPIGGVGVPTFTIRPAKGLAPVPIGFQLLRGRAPQVEGEVVIGPTTAHDMRVGVGDTIKVGDQHLSARIVGEGLFPSDVHAEFDEGAWLTPTQFDKIVPPSPHARVLAARIAPRRDEQATIAALRQALPPGSDVSPAEVPVELANLRNVRTLPILLAGFLALLAIAAVSHVLVTSSRRRRHEFAILRALGLQGSDARLVLNAQSSAIGIVGLVVGVPVGIVVGRVIWRLVTERVPLDDVPPFALAAVVLIVPITAIIVNALAVWPGRRVVEFAPAEVLRSE